MAADRGRDLKFSLLSDLDRFDVDEAARQLDDLGDAARDTGRRLDDLGDDAKRVDLEDKLGDDAKRAARKVDDAFDAIARSSKAAERKVDRDTRDMRDGLDDVGDEASQTAREMGASFGGTTDDIVDAFQELGANAAAGFGPVGVAAGVAASLGVGLIRAEAEKLQEQVSEMVDAMIESGGRLSEEAITGKLQEMASEGTLKTLKEQAEAAGVSFGDLARAHAGDAEALERVQAALFDSSAAMNENVQAGKIGTQQAYNQKLAIDEVARGLSDQLEVQALATEAVNDYATTTEGATDSAKSSVDKVRDAWGKARAEMGDPINARVNVTAPTPAQLRGIRAGIQAGLGEIVVPVKAGQSRYSNTADNSRYRW